MSNVLVGIIGVILFIGMAIGGAAFFGPRVFQATNQGIASVVMTELGAVAMAVQTKDRTLEMATRATATTSDLAPTYLPSAPRNPTFGPEPMLLTQTGDTSGGVAQFAAMMVAGSNPSTLCDEISRSRGGPAIAPTLAGPPTGSAMGAYKVNRSLTAQIPANSCVAYAIIP